MAPCSTELRLSSHDFRRLRDLIYRVAGIHLVDAKKTMVELRLRKRLVKLGCPSFAAYCEFLFGDGGEHELPSMIDLVTTNKTDFYREAAHFDYLTRVALRELRAGFDRPLAVWSAGCSSGEEPYTLAMVLSDFAGQQEARYEFDILATDISGRMLEKARLGIYEMDAIAPIPAEARRRYLLKSRNPQEQTFRIAPEIRKCVQFLHLNLMDSDYRLARAQDVIFCRNVVIYFDKATKEQLIGRLARNLRPGGYLFMGHSEALHGFDLPLAAVAPTIYRRQEHPI